MTKNHMKKRGAKLVIVFLALAGFPLVTQATSVTPPEFIQLVQESDYVVLALVKSVTAENKAPPGRRPVIYSHVELDVKQVIAGEPPSPLVLKVLGGKLGDQEMHISGTPKFTVGEEAIFFVQGNGTQIYPLVRMMHGLYPVLHDPATGKEFVARSNGEPMSDVAQVQQPMHGARRVAAGEPGQATAAALSPEEFITRIRATAKEIRASEK